MGSLAELWVAPNSAPVEEEGDCMGIRGRNSVNVEHLDQVLGTGEKTYSSCLPSLFFSPGDTLLAFLCWLPCQVEGAPSLIHCLDGPVWSLAAKKKRAISFQEVGTCHLGDGRRCPG